jgi:hypothetical protein
MLKKTAANIRTRPPRAEKPASIQGNMRVKEAGQQSHKISLLSALK